MIGDLREAGAETELAGSLAGNVAFLRHRVAGLEHRDSSDWDLAVRNDQEAGWTIENLLGHPLLKVAKRYVTQRYFPWGQIDLLPVFEWQGIPYLSRDRFWSRVEIGKDGLPRPCIAHDAFIAWMTGLLWGGHYRQRYDGMIARAVAEQADELETCLEEAFGARWGQRLMAAAAENAAGRAVAWVGRLRRALWRRAALREPDGTLAGQVRHWSREILHHLEPPFPWVAFLGPDGSGKSTVIAGLRERLKETRIGVMEAHWGPRPRRQGESPGPPVTDPQARPPRGWLLSIAKTGWLAMRWTWSQAGPVGHARSKRAMLVSDRYFDDLLVDPRRYRYGADLGWARAMFRWLRRPDRVIFLLGDPQAIHARKKEVPLVELDRQLVAYRALADSLGERARVIDAGLPPEQVIEQAWQAVFAIVPAARN